eukprot:TRINITY_DN1835_c0_g1_i1.p1 TRINITY_DN1835_c0_g1~~TRINITY_DN1835_c0_g1_i1.p1  ORF type:complete len:195 (+),score=41.72 TRINITY_DN1835_c0_g1_i1:180-764(+)
MPSVEFRVAFLGTVDVGKTTTILRYVEGHFTDGKKEHNFDMLQKTITVDGNTVQFYITDTAGQERFRTLTSSYYRNANAIIIVYDVTNKTSFEESDLHIQTANRFGSNTSAKFLVANKMDLESHVVDTATGEELAKKYNIPFFEISAKTGQGLEQMFEKVAQACIANGPSQTKGNIRLGAGGKATQNRSMCQLL